MFAIFRAEVRVIDHTKRANLSHLLLDNVTSTAPGERLEEKLASLAFHHDIAECTSLWKIPHIDILISPPVPPPSSDEAAWWDGPGESPRLVFVHIADLATRPSWRSIRCVLR